MDAIQLNAAQARSARIRGPIGLFCGVLGALLLAGIVFGLISQTPSRHLINLERGLFVPNQAGPVSDDGYTSGLPQFHAAPIRLPHDWRGRSSATAGWYLFDLELTVAPDRLWGVWLPRVSHDARIFVNGRPLSGGLAADSPNRNQSAPILRRVANGHLAPGINRIAIQVSADRAGHGLLSGVWLGPYSELLVEHERAVLVRQDALRVIVSLMVVVACFAALLWYWRPRESVFGWFAVMLLMWALHDAYQLTPLRQSFQPVLEWFWHASLVGFVYSVYLFVSRFLHLKDGPFERRLAIWAIVMMLVPLPIAVFAPQLFFNWVAPISDTSALLISSYPLILMSLVLLRRPTLIGIGMTAAGALPLFLGAHDWLVIMEILPRTHGFLMPFGSVMILLVFGGYLTHRFGRVLGDLESLNAELEQRVSEREAEIAIKHQRLMKLEAERVLLDERARLMSDMHDGLGGTLISTLAMVQSGQTNPDLLASALREAIDDLRLMIDSLDPVDGDLGSVLANMRVRIEPKLRAAGIRLEWAVDDLETPERLGSQGVLQIMRIVQESFNNIIKHAQASTIRVVVSQGPELIATQSLRQLATSANTALAEHLGQAGEGAATAITASENHARAADDSIWVSIIDDGVGLPGGTRGGGRGLGNMRRRAEAIDGNIQIIPADPGTCVILQIPVA